LKDLVNIKTILDESAGLKGKAQTANPLIHTRLEFNVAQDIDLCQCEEKKNSTDPYADGGEHWEVEKSEAPSSRHGLTHANPMPKKAKPKLCMVFEK